MTDHLKNIVASYYVGMQKANMLVAVFAIDGVTVFATDKFVRLFGDVFFSESFHSSLRQNLLEKQPSELVNKLLEYHLLVIESKTDYQYLLNIELAEGIRSYRIITCPIFSPEGEVIAVEIKAKIFCLFPFSQIFIDGIKKQPKRSSQNINLSLRQRQIVFYLLLNYSQNTIAQLMGISRGTICKIIAEDICPKFDLPGNSATLLVNEILKYDFQYLIPQGIFDTPALIHIN